MKLFSKKFIKTFMQLLFLYGFFLVGEWLQNVLHLPLPGSIIGLILLLALLLLKILPLSWIESGSLFYLSFLPIFFLPATIGAMDYGHIFVGKGFILILIVIVSTILTMGISSYTSQIIARKTSNKEERF